MESANERTHFGPFCLHRWTEVGRDVRTPVESLKFGGGLMPDFVNDLVYGYTTISLRCRRCGSVKTSRVRGVFESSAPKTAVAAADYEEAQSDPRDQVVAEAIARVQAVGSAGHNHTPHATD